MDSLISGSRFPLSAPPIGWAGIAGRMRLFPFFGENDFSGIAGSRAGAGFILLNRGKTAGKSVLEIAGSLTNRGKIAGKWVNRA
jgi:hypothetical protein